MVIFEALAESDQPIIITQSEYMRRMKDMSAMSSTAGIYGNFPDSYNLVVNTNHSLIHKLREDKDKKLSQKIEKIRSEIKPLEDEKDALRKSSKGKKEEEIPVAEKTRIDDLDKQISEKKDKMKEVLSEYASKNKLVRQLIDLALLSNNMLRGEDLARFVRRSVELIK